MLRAPVITTPATDEPIAIEDARDFVGAGGDGLDQRLTAAIGMARAAIEATTGLRLMAQTVTVRADAFEDLSQLNVAPVREVEQIAYRDAAGDLQALPADRYELTGDGLDRGVRAAIGTNWPTVDRRGGGIIARLSVGWEDTDAVPRDLRWALLVLIRAGIDDQVADVSALIGNWRLY